MRVAPRAWIAIGLAVVYIGIVSAMWVVTGTDYATIGQTTGGALTGVVVPVGLGAVFLTAAVTRLGWWRPALREESRTGPSWLLVVPVLYLLAAAGSLLSADLSALTAGYLLALTAGMLLVGFSEEMLCRGAGLVGLRGSLPEMGAWFVSCLVFGLLHSVNALFGQGWAETGYQVVLAFVAGSVLYLTRRLTGSLIWCMLLHAFWDFSTLAAAAGGPSAPSLWPLLTFLQWPAFVLGLLGVALVLRRGVPRTASRVV